MAWHSRNVIRCGWEQDAAGRIRIWVTDAPNVAGAGAKWSEALDAFIDAVMDAAPDLDRIIPVVPQFDPPVPAAAVAAPFIDPELYLIEADESFSTYGDMDERNRYAASLFESVCPDCEYCIGTRTTVPLRSDDVGSADIGVLQGTGFSRWVYSARFLAELTPEERARIEFHPTQLFQRSRRRSYHELCSDSPIPYVGIAGIDSSGWECSACGTRVCSLLDPWLNHAPTRITEAICLNDLPDPLPDLFVVGAPATPKLAATTSRARQLVGSERLKGLTMTRLGVVSQVRCDRRPQLAIRGRWNRCPGCASWPRAVDIAGKSRRRFPLTDRAWSRTNWTWIEPALAEGELLPCRRTHSLDELLADPTSPVKTGLLSFRCPGCLRLGYVSRWDESVSFHW